MKKKRSESRIIFEILTIIAKEDNCRVSTVLRGANISYSKFKEIEETLLEKKLISKNSNGERHRYRITKEGREFLKEWRKFKRLMEMYGFEP